MEFYDFSHNNRLVIDLGEIRQLVHVKTCVGSEYGLRDDRYVLNKLWNQGETMHLVQAVVTDLNEALKTLKPYPEIQEMFPEGCVVFLPATQWYGSMGHYVDVTDRVIIARETEVVPLGYRGTIIDIHLAKEQNPIRQESVAKEDKYFDILFDVGDNTSSASSKPGIGSYELQKVPS